jgi:hypothetical protein
MLPILYLLKCFIGVHFFKLAGFLKISSALCYTINLLQSQVLATGDIWLKRHIKEFLNAEGETPIHIHECLKNGLISLNQNPKGSQRNGITQHSRLEKSLQCTISRFVMASMFWDEKGVILLDFLELGNTVNADHYIATLNKLGDRLR